MLDINLKKLTDEELNDLYFYLWIEKTDRERKHKI